MKYEKLTEKDLINRVCTDASQNVRIWNDVRDLIENLEEAAINRKLAGEVLAELTTNLLRKTFAQSKEAMGENSGIVIENPLNGNNNVTKKNVNTVVTG